MAFDGPVPDMIEEKTAVRMTNNNNQPWDYEEDSIVADNRYDHQLYRKIRNLL